jgi:hypothetical protein
MSFKPRRYGFDREKQAIKYIVIPKTDPASLEMF